MKVRTRMAPSPTGEFHIGGMRTLLYNYSFAKKHEGEFVLRIEDTDRSRYVEGAVERTINIINEYGFTPDEGPLAGGPHAPYVQSERLKTYKQYAEDLVHKGWAYYCFLTPEETKEYQEIFRKQNKRFRSPFRDKSKGEMQKMIDEGKSHVIRLKVPDDREIVHKDVVLGDIVYKTEEIDDQILLKSDGYPTYHLAVVIDDQMMKITHVMRGKEWLPSTPKHILLYEAFGWEAPVYAHLPNLKEKGANKKMSKRFGDVYAQQFLASGYLPEALNNFLMFLGWNPGDDREMFSLEEFSNEFTLERIGKSELVAFDRDKLEWYNKKYLEKMATEDLKNYLIRWLEKHAEDKSLMDNLFSDPGLEKKLELVKERSRTLVELVQMLDFFYNFPSKVDLDIKQLKRINKVDGLRSKLLEDVVELFDGLESDSDVWTHEEWENAMRSIGDKNDAKHGDVFMLLRVAVVGSPVSPPLFESLQILGKKEILKRLKASK